MLDDVYYIYYSKEMPYRGGGLRDIDKLYTRIRSSRPKLSQMRSKFSFKNQNVHFDFAKEL